MKTIFILQGSSSQNVPPRAPRVQMNSRRLCKSTFKEFKGQNYFFVTLIPFSFKTVLACALRVQKPWWIKPSVSNKLLHIILFFTNTYKSECGTKCFLSLYSLPACVCRKTKFQSHIEMSLMMQYF